MESKGNSNADYENVEALWQLLEELDIDLNLYHVFKEKFPEKCSLANE